MKYGSNLNVLSLRHSTIESHGAAGLCSALLCFKTRAFKDHGLRALTPSALLCKVNHDATDLAQPQN